MTKPSEHALKSLWRGQPTEANPMTLNDVRNAADRFQRAIRWRNAVEYFAAACVLLIFGSHMFYARERISTVVACALIIAATLFVIYYMRRKGYATTPPVGGDLRTYLEYLIGDLTRQRDLSRRIFWWYLTPFIPGFAMSFVDRLLHPPSAPKLNVYVGLGIYFAFLMVVYVGGYWWNQSAARRMQTGIESARDTLRSLDDSPTS